MAIYKAEHLRENDFQHTLDGLIITKWTYHPNVYPNWHYHENPSLTLILKGGAIDQRKKEEKAIGAGDLVLHRSEELHRNKFLSENSRHFCIEMEPGWFKKFDIPNHFEAKSLLLVNPVIKAKVISVLGEFIDSGSTKNISVETLLLDCITDLNAVTISNYYPTWLNSLKELLHDEYYTDWSLAQLAKRMNVHPVTISKYFTRYFKTTIGDYIRKIKICKSFSDLSNKSKAINNIGTNSGFADHAHFTKNFKKYTGVTPSEYREFVFG